MSGSSDASTVSSPSRVAVRRENGAKRKDGGRRRVGVVRGMIPQSCMCRLATHVAAQHGLDHVWRTKRRALPRLDADDADAKRPQQRRCKVIFAHEFIARVQDIVSAQVETLWIAAERSRQHRLGGAEVGGIDASDVKFATELIRDGLNVSVRPKPFVRPVRVPKTTLKNLLDLFRD